MRTYTIVYEAIDEVVADNLTSLSQVAEHLGMTGIEGLARDFLEGTLAYVFPYVVVANDEWNPLASWNIKETVA